MGRKPAKPWTKLECDWFDHDGFMVLESMNARDALDWPKLMAIWCDFEGARIDMNKKGHALKLSRRLRRSEKSLRSWLDLLASPDVELIDPGMWSMGIVTSGFAADEAQRRENRKSGGARGGKATAEKSAEDAA